jgi:hypothetical protein
MQLLWLQRALTKDWQTKIKYPLPGSNILGFGLSKPFNSYE